MGTWTQVNNMLESRYTRGSWGHTQSALGMAGGSGDSANTEEYDGTSWRAGGALTTGREAASGAGTLNAGIMTGGYIRGSTTSMSITEEYNGTTWSLANPLNNGDRYFHGCNGLAQNSCLVFSGRKGLHYMAPIYTLMTEEYDGTSWSDTSNYLYNDYHIAGSGSQSSIISVGGTKDMDYSASYNGSTWTFLSNTSTDHGNGAMAAGEPSSALVAGHYGDVESSKSTEEFNGTSWGTESDLNAGRAYMNQTGGSHEAAVAAGGYSSSTLISTEEWDDVPFCWNFTARYSNSNKLFKASGPGSYPKNIQVPNNIDKNTSKLIDDGKEIDSDDYNINSK